MLYHLTIGASLLYLSLIDPNIISHPANCQLLPHKTNVSKGKKNSITLEALLDLIEKWEEKYSGGG